LALQATYRALPTISTYEGYVETARGYDMKPVPYRYEYDTAKDTVSIRAVFIEKKNKNSKSDPVGPEIEAPLTPARSNTVAPAIGVDTASYILGYDDGTGKKVAEKFEAHLALMRRCHAETGNPRVGAAILSLERYGRGEYGVLTPPDMKCHQVVMVVVDGKPITDDEDVRKFWANEMHGDIPGGLEMESCITGKRFIAREKHAPMLKNFGGGMIRLLTNDAESTCSHGLSRCQNTPIETDVLEDIAKALNFLLKNKDTHLWMGDDSTYVFFGDDGVTSKLFSGMYSSPKLVKDLLQAGRTTSLPIGMKTGNFVLISLTDKTGRHAMRVMQNCSLEDFYANSKLWVQAAEMTDRRGDACRIISVTQMARSILDEDELKKAYSKSAKYNRALKQTVDCQLTGSRISDYVLNDFLQIIKTAKDLTQERAAGIKAILVSQAAKEKREELAQRMSELDPTCDNVPYLCGRCFYLMDKLQKEAIGKENGSTLAENHYGSVQRNPGVEINNHIMRAQSIYWPKIQRVRMREGKNIHSGAGAAIYKRLVAVYSLVGQSIPSSFTMSDRGMFNLGFIHESAHDERCRREFLEQSRAANSQPNTVTDLNEAANGIEISDADGTTDNAE
jgi:hypothetical protein